MTGNNDTPRIFNATVTKGIIPFDNGVQCDPANYGISPAPGLPSEAGFRFREDAQAAADKLNAENYGEPIPEDPVFDGVFDGCLDSTPWGDARRGQSLTVWTDRNGINVAGLDVEMTMSDAEAKALAQKLLAVIDPEECGLDGDK